MAGRPMAAWPPVAALSRCQWGDRSLLDHVQSVLDDLLDDPPPEPAPAGPTGTPWWRPTPDVWLAALLRHAALPGLAARPGRVPPHARQSAVIAREALREAGCSFELREHAVALIADSHKPLSLPRSGAHGETYMRLACALDVRALWRLEQAEAQAAGSGEALARLDAFARHAAEVGAFGSVPPPPVAEERAREAGYEEPGELHRALNALRYFRLVAGMQEPEWCRERLRLERGRPACRLHILVGPAGVGKTTWAEANLAQTVIVSTDLLRTELAGDPTDQSRNYLVFQRCMDRVRTELHRGREVTFDATNASEGLREMPVQAGRWSGAEIVSWFFDVGMEEALRRNASRERFVPESVLRRQFRFLRPPALYEADRHMVVGPDGAARCYWPAGARSVQDRAAAV